MRLLPLLLLLLWLLMCCSSLLFPLRRRKEVMYYPGLLVTEELLNQLQIYCYCPTALELPALDYEQDGKLVKVLVIGDPEQPGAIINDGEVEGSSTDGKDEKGKSVFLYPSQYTASIVHA